MCVEMGVSLNPSFSIYQLCVLGQVTLFLFVLYTEDAKTYSTGLS